MLGLVEDEEEGNESSDGTTDDDVSIPEELEDAHVVCLTELMKAEKEDNIVNATRA